MVKYLIQLVKERKVIQKSLLIGFLITLSLTAILTLFVYLDVGFKISTSVIFNEVGNALFGIQLWIWMGLIIGFSAAIFFNFFSRIFGKANIPLNKEIDDDEDITTQTNEYQQQEKQTISKLYRVVLFNLSGVIVASLSLLLSYVLSSQ